MSQELLGLVSLGLLFYVTPVMQLLWGVLVAMR